MLSDTDFTGLLAQLAPLDVDSVLAEGSYAQTLLTCLNSEHSSTSDHSQFSKKRASDGNLSSTKRLDLGNGFQTDDTHLIVASLFTLTPFTSLEISALHKSGRIIPHIWKSSIVCHVQQLIDNQKQHDIHKNSLQFHSFLSAYALLPRSIATFDWLDAFITLDLNKTGAAIYSDYLQKELIYFLTECIDKKSQQSIGQMTVHGMISCYANQANPICLNPISHVIQLGCRVFSKPLHFQSNSKTNPTVTDNTLRHSRTVLEWILQCQKAPCFDMVIDTLCRIVYITKLKAFNDQLIQICCDAIHLIFSDDSILDSVSVQQQSFFKTLCLLITSNSTWEIVMDAAVKGVVDIPIFFGSLRELAYLDTHSNLYDSILKNIELAIQKRDVSTMCLFLCSTVLVYQSDTKGLISSLRKVFFFKSNLPLKSVKEWVLQSLTSLVEVLPVVIVKSLVNALRPDPFWTIFVKQAKVKLDILGETLGTGMSISKVLSVDKVLDYFNQHGVVPASLIDASIFHAEWYNKTFLPQLLRKGNIMGNLTHIRLIQLLRNADRIPQHVFAKIEAEKSQIDTNTTRCNDSAVDTIASEAKNTLKTLDSVSYERIRQELQTLLEKISNIQHDISFSDASQISSPSLSSDLIAHAKSLCLLVDLLCSSIALLYPIVAFDRCVGFNTTTGLVTLSRGSIVYPEEQQLITVVFLLLNRFFQIQDLEKQSSKELALDPAAESLLDAACSQSILFPAIVTHLQFHLQYKQTSHASSKNGLPIISGELLGYLFDRIQRITSRHIELDGIKGDWNQIWIVQGSMKPGDDSNADRRGLFQALFSRFVESGHDLTVQHIYTACEWLYSRRFAIASEQTHEPIRKMNLRFGGFAKQIARQLWHCKQRFSTAPSDSLAVNICSRIDQILETMQFNQDMFSSTMKGYSAWVRFEATFPRELDWMDDLTRIDYIRVHTARHLNTLYEMQCILSGDSNDNANDQPKNLNIEYASIFDRMLTACRNELYLLTQEMAKSKMADPNQDDKLVSTQYDAVKMDLYISGFMTVLDVFKQYCHSEKQQDHALLDSNVDNYVTWLWTIK
ncbi:hypothetical protein O5D80_006215 [Batrachochytrium dendrobatidis]|nr:hypothetical protein O5D80_006215 [Batrachochytrium dendrobatidis]